MADVLLSALLWLGLGHVQTCEVGDVLERVVRRIERHLRRRRLLRSRTESRALRAIRKTISPRRPYRGRHLPPVLGG
jgi:hypothetical protein